MYPFDTLRSLRTNKKTAYQQKATSLMRVAKRRTMDTAIPYTLYSLSLILVVAEEPPNI
jgi:hypothetical protein